MSKKRFVIIGAAGYIAKKHIEAISKIDGELIATFDPSCSMGILDQFFPECHHFTGYERLERFCESKNIDYVVVCSPNNYHDAHCRFGLRMGADVICEKPVVLTEKNLDRLLEAEQRYGKSVIPVMQLRLLPALSDIEANINKLSNHISIQYHLPRGKWYNYSWQGDIEASGGIHTNIGIHIYDILCHFFGDSIEIIENDNLMSIQFKNAYAYSDLRTDIKDPKRIFKINNQQISLVSKENLHDKFYQMIKNNIKPFTLESVRRVTKLTEAIRNM